jgi:capsular polysaccharide transport system permease protein
VHRLLRGPTFGSMEFTVYFVTGLIPYFFFQKLVFRLLDGVDANRGLFNYRQVKPMDALMARAAVEGLLYVVVYSVTLVVLGWGGLEVVPDLPLQVIMVNGLTGVFGASMGLLFAVLGHDRHRLRSTIRLSFLPLYFASGVILRLDLLPQHVVDLLLWNPLIHLVELSRHGFYARYPTPAGVNIYYPFAWTLVSAALGLSLYRVNRLRLLTIN